MDNRAEALFKNELKRLTPEQTLVLITHKTSMLEVVDRLVVMHAGNVVADGPKDKVLKELQRGNLKSVNE